MARETVKCRRLRRRFNRARSNTDRRRLHQDAKRAGCAWAPRAVRTLGFKTMVDFENDPEEWDEYKERYWGHMRKCALYTVVAHKGDWLEREGRRTGPREICLSPSQVRKLFGAGRPPRLLGCGMFACAWEKGKRRVVKITMDADDVTATEAAQGLKHVVKLFGSYGLMNAATDEKGDRDDAYAMVVERMYELPDEMREWAGSLPNHYFREAFVDHYGTDSVDPEDADSSFSISPASRETITDYICAYEDREGGCDTFANQVVDTVEQLGKRGILVHDLHDQNVMATEKGVWKITDLGVSGTSRPPDVPALYGLGARRRGTRGGMRMQRGKLYKVGATGFTIEMIPTGYRIRRNGKVVAERSSKQAAFDWIRRQI